MSATFLLPLAAESLDTTVRVVAVVITFLMFLVVLELVRRRQLAERYALVWMIVAGTLLVLAVWTDLLGWATDLVGIQVPANGLFLAAIGVAFLLLLHFSVVTSRLSEETKILAQEVARLDGELRAARANGAGPAGESAASSAESTHAEASPASAGRASAEHESHEPPVRGEQAPE